MVGQVAIQRKLLILTYTLWKNNSTYVDDYEKTVARTKIAQATQDGLQKESLL